MILVAVLFLSACSQEDDNQDISAMSEEEISQMAEKIVEELEQSGELDFSTEQEVEFPLDPDGLPEFLKTLEAHTEVQASYNACPGTIFQKYNTYEDHMSINDSYEALCARDPDQCLRQCIEDDNGPACHDLAYVLEENEQKIGDQYGKMMYAQGCATGWPLSCTNRGAGIRNALNEKDPFFGKDEVQTNMCLNAMFERMCEENEVWGCYMTGVSFSEGEGRAIDESKADLFFKRACEVDSQSGACSN